MAAAVAAFEAERFWRFDELVEESMARRRL
jgi:hypothetical protein